MNPKHKEILDQILASAVELRRTVEAVPDTLLGKRPKPEEWSVVETLVHVRNVVMLVYGMRIRQLLFQERPTFANYDEGQHLLSASRQQLSGGEILEMIETEHRQTVRLLSTLSEEDWQRQGQHLVLGTMSIEFLAQRIALHAEEHRQQIAATVEALS